MFFSRTLRSSLVLMVSLLALAGCQEDMMPSSKDQRSENQNQVGGSVGGTVGSTVEDFSYTLSTGEQNQLNTLLQTHDAVVLYFTMWCPVCTEHMQHIQVLTAEHPNIAFVFVDYLTNSVANTRQTQLSQGWYGFDTISDFDNALENQFDGTMAITVVIDKNSIVKLNEEFKNGARLKDVLNTL